MSRPKPTVILEHVNKKNYKSDQILQSEAIWAVFYKGKPFNLKTSNVITNYPGPNYKKVFQSHANNQRKNPNSPFETKDFEVYKLTTGTVV